jgi:uncharacterized protein
MDLPRRNSPEELDAFEALCRQLSGFEPVVNFELVDGYLTALATLPVWPPAEGWIEHLCEDAFDRAFADPPARAQAMRVIDRRLAVLRDQLDPDPLYDDPPPLRLDPLLADPGDARDENGRLRYPLAMTWAAGCLRGLEFVALQIGEVDDETHRDDFVSLQRWVADVARLDHDDADEATRHERLDGALFAVQELRLWALGTLEKVMPRRVEAKPGRNDPCPCGSGRKYKKCHGAT